jgi:type VI secretion system protein
MGADAFNCGKVSPDNWIRLMGLRIEVATGRGAGQTYEMEEDKLLIGRNQQSHLVLADNQRIISNTHAYVVREHGAYLVVDCSTNGLTLNDVQVASKSKSPLQHGDRIVIGQYALAIEIFEDKRPTKNNLLTPQSAGSLDPPISVPAALQGLAGDETASKQPTSNPPGDGEFTQADAEPEDPIAALLNAQPKPPIVQATEGNTSSVFESAFIAPSTTPDHSAPVNPGITAEQDEIPSWAQGLSSAHIGESAAAQPAPPPAGQAGQPKSSSKDTTEQMAAQLNESPHEPISAGQPIPDDQLEALLAGLGLSLTTPPDANTLHEIGSVLHVLLDGVIEVLLARSEIKNQMRLRRTMLQAQDNNPIKVSINAKDALEMMFVNRRHGFLDAVAAAKDTVTDLAAHEIAMTTAFKASTDTFIKDLDPDALERRFQQSMGKGMGLSMLEKAKYWDAYRDFYENQIAEGDFIMQSFSDAYDEAAQNLKRMRRLNPNDK